MNKNLIKRYFFNLFGIIFSRASGLIRDLALTGFLGAGLHSDLFYAMLRLPQIFRALLTEGVFNQAFLPHLKSAQTAGCAGKFIIRVGVIFLAICALICAAVSVFSPQIISLIAPGFGPADAEQAAFLLRISIWFLLFNFCACFAASLSNFFHKFFLAAALNSIFNVVCALSLAGSIWLGKLNALALCAAAISAAAALQAVILAFYLRAKLREIFAQPPCGTSTVTDKKTSQPPCGVSTVTGQKSSEEKLPVSALLSPGGASAASAQNSPVSLPARVAGFLRTFSAAFCAALAQQIGSLIELAIASSYAAAAITYIQLATRLYQLPLSLLAIALSQVLLPAIIAKTCSASARAAYFWALAFALFAAACVGYFFADFIVSLLFERGSFSAADAAATANLLRAYIWLIVPLGLSRVLLSELASALALRRAAIISALSVALNCAMILLLLPRVGLVAFGYAATLSATFVLLGYALELRRLKQLYILRAKFFALSAGASAFALVIIYFLKGFFYANF